VLKKVRTKARFWEEVRTLLKYFRFDNWEMLFKKIVYSIRIPAETAMNNPP
jgi:hypothetical protein